MNTGKDDERSHADTDTLVHIHTYILIYMFIYTYLRGTVFLNI